MLPEKVIWTEGMLLKPQHLQQMDRYNDAQWSFRAANLSNYGWGFTEFTIDEQYLSLGKIVLSRAKGIMPDGTLFEIAHGQEGVSLDIPDGATNRRVMLVLPASPEGSIESRSEDNATLPTRFIARQKEVRDSNAGHTGEALISCGQLDLKLMFEEDTSSKGHVAMPVAQVVECKADKGVLLDKDFFPSFLHLEASPELSGNLREIIGLISHRGDQLAQRVSSAGNTGTAEIADFMLLQTINRMEPVFRHQEKTPHLHPENFYIQLVALVGELASFVESGKRPRDIADYDHARQYQSFANLMEQARYALSMVLEQHAVELPMQKRKYGITVSPIHDRSLLANASFILVVRADMDQDAIRANIPKQVKISSVESIRDLVNLHLPGIRIRPLPVAPRQIPFHAGKSYFQLDFTSEELAQLELSGGFAFYVSGTFPGLQLQFWAIKE